MPKPLSDIGLVGLAVMGQNLALNIADHGFQISVFNRTTEKTDKFVADNPNTPGGVVGSKTIEEFRRLDIEAEEDNPAREGGQGDGRRHRRASRRSWRRATS
jgi:hypothetical protein